MTKSMGVLLAAAMVAGAWGLAACSEEVAHSEKTGKTWTGATKHEETTVYKNPDGSLSTEHEKQVVK